MQTVFSMNVCVCVCVGRSIPLRSVLRDNETLSEYLKSNLSLSSSTAQRLISVRLRLNQVQFNTLQLVDFTNPHAIQLETDQSRNCWMYVYRIQGLAAQILESRCLDFLSLNFSNVNPVNDVKICFIPWVSLAELKTHVMILRCIITLSSEQHII